MFTLTTATKKVAGCSKKIRAIQGGTSASKTISILLHLIHESQSDTEPKLSSVVSESIPHLKRGAIRDFKNILLAHKYWDDNRWNATDSIYTFETGSQVEFFSSDNGDKLRGGRRDRCFINEANNVTLDAFDQLEVRTKEYIYLDWNPSIEFWFYTDVLIHRPDDVDHIIVTYLDNEALSSEIVASIESRKNRAQWWKVYGLGQLGEVEGKVYTDWIQIDNVPHEARHIGRGLDFGYTNDPTAITDVYWYNGGFILDELIYQKGMSNQEIATALKEDNILTVADSAEPKSIDEIKKHGITIVGADKGKDSIVHGIQVLQDQKISVTKRSINVWREYMNYLWDKDKQSGQALNKPESGFDHALDGIRYFITRYLKKDQESVEEFYTKLRYKNKGRATHRAGLR
jgi:phage terminase large subunit